MKDFTGKLQYNGNEYTLVFNLNVMEQIQDAYGSLDEWGKLTDGESGEPNAKAIIFGLSAMINEGIDMENEENGTNRPFLTTRQVGRMITEYGVAKASVLLNETVIESTRSEEKNA